MKGWEKKVWGSPSCIVSGLGIAKKNFLGFWHKEGSWILNKLSTTQYKGGRGVTLRATQRKLQNTEDPWSQTIISEEVITLREINSFRWHFFFSYLCTAVSHEGRVEGECKWSTSTRGFMYLIRVGSRLTRTLTRKWERQDNFADFLI